MATPEDLKQTAETQLQTRLTDGVASYSIGNRSVQKDDPSKSIEVLKELMWMVERSSRSPFALGKMGKRSR